MNNILWKPSLDVISNTNIESLRNLINSYHSIELETYQELYDWSIQNIENFWKIVWEDCEIIFSKNYSSILDDQNKMPGAKWFNSSRLNFAENLLKFKNENLAIDFFGENKENIQISYNELYSLVAKVSFSFKEMGIVKGDRIGAIMPNIPETIICMLAASSLGAVWSSCSPDFGYQGILDRFSQIEPKIIVTTNGYYFKGKIFNIEEKIKSINSSISSIEKIIMIDYIDKKNPNNYFTWRDIISNDSVSISFEQLPFNYPLYIMYSSGTTGKPKSIVHSSGGTLIQHLKELKYHVDLKNKDKIFYYTTCGWMMWNWLVSSLSLGATVTLYEGSPFYPKTDSLLQIIDGAKVNIFGTSAKYISYLKGTGCIPKKIAGFKQLKTILSTGSPLTEDLFEYVYNYWKKEVQLSSISGGTDIISCFALGCPTLPVIKGELQCLGLGMSVKSYSEQGVAQLNVKGELICDKPFPSMPIYFWNDNNKKKYRKAYFNKYSNVWTHGDFILINNNYGVKIFGRSDATLNPGGVRIGTSEIYHVVETISYIEDSLAIGQNWKDDERIVLFIKIKGGGCFSDKLEKEIKNKIKSFCSPRHVPSKIIPIEDIPYTINGKKVEIAVKNIINGFEPDNKSSLSNPESLDLYKNIIELNQ